jgi:hypothetical protein
LLVPRFLSRASSVFLLHSSPFALSRFLLPIHCFLRLACLTLLPQFHF